MRVMNSTTFTRRKPTLAMRVNETAISSAVVITKSIAGNHPRSARFSLGVANSRSAECVFVRHPFAFSFLFLLPRNVQVSNLAYRNWPAANRLAWGGHYLPSPPTGTHRYLYMLAVLHLSDKVGQFYN